MRTSWRTVVLAAATAAVLVIGPPVRAEPIDSLHFLVPGGAGGGWDSTARGVGEALTKAGLLQSASYENMSGGGGGRAMAHMIETAARQHGTLMVNSAPTVVRSLRGDFPQSFRDLTPVAAVIGDYAAVVVTAESPYRTLAELLAAFDKDPRRTKVAGGSVRGGMDHVVAASVMKGAGKDPNKLVYIPYDAGGKAFAGFLSGDAEVLSTGFGEALEPMRAGQVRILCVTAPARQPVAAEIPTCREAGADMEFMNWRGFFGPPGLPADLAAAYADLLKRMMATQAWATIRDRNGWVELYRPLDEFAAFLDQEDAQTKALLNSIGFETVR